MSNQVFISLPVSQVLRLYDGLVDDHAWVRPVAEQLDLLAARLLDGHCDKAPGAAVEFRNWLPNAPADIFAARLSIDEARLTVARGHGFSGWPSAPAALRAGSASFEKAVELLLAGDIAGLAEALDAKPDLVGRRSHYGHGATLLHYLAANGVEIYRQRVPLNAAEIASLLIARGADPLAEADFYGKKQKTRGLLLSSSHPADAGVTPDVLRVLDC
jgi:hypothetical protein